MKWLTTTLLLLLSVKVTSVNHGTGRVEFLLPMHATEIVALLDEAESTVGVEEGKFYEATFDKEGRLVVKAKKRKVRFKPEKIKFHSN